MKKLNIPIAVFALFTVSLLFSPRAFSEPDLNLYIPESVFDLMAAEQDSVINFDTIKNELSSDGEWIKVDKDEIDSESVTDGSQEIDDDINTEYVWRPYGVDENWNPYTNGRWVYTSCGWMWVSYYSWGWRPFHYGRWWWSPTWGWVWSPGYIWAPSWVVWMTWGDYCGWYPLSPRVRWHHRHHHHGYYCGHVRFRVRHWVFVERRHFTSIEVNRNVIEPDRNASILQYADFNSSIEYANGKVENKGPEVTKIENSTGEKITPKNVDKYNSTGKVKEYTEKTIEREKKQDELYQKKETNVNSTRGVTKEGNNNTGTYNEKKSSNENNTGRSSENKGNESFGKNNEGNNNNGNNNTGKKNDNGNNNSGKKNDNGNNNSGNKNNQYKAPERKNDSQNNNNTKQNNQYKAPEKKNDSQNMNKNSTQQKQETFKAPEKKNETQNINKNTEKKSDNGSNQKKDNQNNKTRQEADKQ